MKNLLDFLLKYYHWVLFVVLEVISMVLLFQYNSYQGSVWFSTANAVTGSFYKGLSAITSFFSLSEVNEDLMLRNFYLERQVTQLRRLYGEANQKVDSVDLQMVRMSQYKLVKAKVITNELHKKNNLMTIDKGSADSIEVGMGVVSGNGIVGVTYLTSAHYSIVIPVLNSKSSQISCAIRGRDYFGVLRWYGGDSGYAYVEDIPRHARFKRGEWVETNGYSSIFPAGVLVGQIVEVYNSRDGLSYKLKVRLATDFGNLRNVAVITDKSLIESMHLMRAAKDSLKLNVSE